ncbi:hypothetical protein SIID45300_00141 [Candidatus Magnetaquicoccaceae bacterium FCR-1]|uniref:Secreted protein n=1 Tax=Candidatus Magnetaquiglobus chichijimensis TaxID=3141448 RepID=A0ABQ0C4N6_9PROT
MESSMRQMGWWGVGGTPKGVTLSFALVFGVMAGWSAHVWAEEDTQWNSGFYRVDPERTPFKIRPPAPRRDYEEDDRGIQWREGRRDDAPPPSGQARGWGRGWNDESRRPSRPWGHVPSQWEESGGPNGGGGPNRYEMEERSSSSAGDRPPVSERWNDGPARSRDSTGSRSGYRDDPHESRGGSSRWDGPYQREYSRGGGRWGDGGYRERGYDDRDPGPNGYEDERFRNDGRTLGRGSGSSGGRYWPEER